MVKIERQAVERLPASKRLSDKQLLDEIQGDKDIKRRVGARIRSQGIPKENGGYPTSLWIETYRNLLAEDAAKANEVIVLTSSDDDSAKKRPKKKSKDGDDDEDESEEDDDEESTGTKAKAPNGSNANEHAVTSVTHKLSFAFYGQSWEYDYSTNMFTATGAEVNTLAVVGFSFDTKAKLERGVVGDKIFPLPKLTSQDNRQFQRNLYLNGYTAEEAQGILSGQVSPRFFRSVREKSMTYSAHTHGLYTLASDKGFLDPIGNMAFMGLRKLEIALRQTSRIRDGFPDSLSTGLRAMMFAGLMDPAEEHNRLRLAQIQEASINFQLSHGLRQAKVVVAESHVSEFQTAQHLAFVIASIASHSRRTADQKHKACHELIRRYCIDYRCYPNQAFCDKVRSLLEQSAKSSTERRRSGELAGTMLNGDWLTNFELDTVIPKGNSSS